MILPQGAKLDDKEKVSEHTIILSLSSNNELPAVTTSSLQPLRAKNKEQRTKTE